MLEFCKMSESRLGNFMPRTPLGSQLQWLVKLHQVYRVSLGREPRCMFCIRCFRWSGEFFLITAPIRRILNFRWTSCGSPPEYRLRRAERARNKKDGFQVNVTRLNFQSNCGGRGKGRIGIWSEPVQLLCSWVLMRANAFLKFGKNVSPRWFKSLPLSTEQEFYQCFKELKTSRGASEPELHRCWSSEKEPKQSHVCLLTI